MLSKMEETLTQWRIFYLLLFKAAILSTFWCNTVTSSRRFAPVCVFNEYLCLATITSWELLWALPPPSLVDHVDHKPSFSYLLSHTCCACYSANYPVSSLWQIHACVMWKSQEPDMGFNCKYVRNQGWLLCLSSHEVDWFWSSVFLLLEIWCTSSRRSVLNYTDSFHR